MSARLRETKQPPVRRWLCAAGILLALVALPGISPPEEPVVLLTDPGLISSSGASDPEEDPPEGRRPNPVDFTAEELEELQRRFGVHGPQPRLAQLFTEGLDHFRPLRSRTFGQLEGLRPVILSESERHSINPVLVAAVLFDELQHAKPGEDHPIAAHSGLFQTHGPAQLSLGELVKQGVLQADASPEELIEARNALLDPDQNVRILVAKFARLKTALDLPTHRPMMASHSLRDAKGLATLAYLHNGKLDYPERILRYMQDPEIHALIYGQRKPLPDLVI